MGPRRAGPEQVPGTRAQSPVDCTDQRYRKLHLRAGEGQSTPIKKKMSTMQTAHSSACARTAGASTSSCRSSCIGGAEWDPLLCPGRRAAAPLKAKSTSFHSVFRRVSTSDCTVARDQLWPLQPGQSMKDTRCKSVRHEKGYGCFPLLFLRLPKLTRDTDPAGQFLLQIRPSHPRGFM